MVGNPQLCVSPETFSAHLNWGMNCRPRYYWTDANFKPSRKERTYSQTELANSSGVATVKLSMSDEKFDYHQAIRLLGCFLYHKQTLVRFVLGLTMTNTGTRRCGTHSSC